MCGVCKAARKKGYTLKEGLVKISAGETLEVMVTLLKIEASRQHVRYGQKGFCVGHPSHAACDDDKIIGFVLVVNSFDEATTL